jgi:hypothetical protein
MTSLSLDGRSMRPVHDFSENPEKTNENCEAFVNCWAVDALTDFFFFPLRSPGLPFQCKHNKKIESYQYMDTKKEKKRKELTLLMLKSPDRAWAEPPKTVEQFIELRTVWWWWWWPPLSNRSCRFVSSSIFYAGLSIDTNKHTLYAANIFWRFHPKREREREYHFYTTHTYFFSYL